MKERKVVCYIAQSMDGYIADPEETLDWLLGVEMDGDAGYQEFIETVDTILLGRRTYDWGMDHENGQFPYTDQKSYVFTSRPDAQRGPVNFTSENPASFAKALKREPGGTIWPVGGSLLLESLLREDLVDEFIISIAPVTLGEGISLFQKVQRRMDFILESVKQDGQIAQLHYRRRRDGNCWQGRPHWVRLFLWRIKQLKKKENKHMKILYLPFCRAKDFRKTKKAYRVDRKMRK